MTDATKTGPLVPDELLPPGVRDERQLAFVRAIDAGLQPIVLEAFIMSDADKVDARLLPYLVREFSLQEFIEPGMPDEVVRRFIKNAYELHAKKGYVEGTRLGLRLLGVEVSWTQWWQQEPKGEPNTHVVTTYANENIFADDSGVFLTEKLQTAVRRIIDATKRWSQDVSFRLGAGYKSKAGVGSAFAGLAVGHRTLRFGRPNSFRAAIGLGSAISGLQIMHRTFSTQGGAA